MPKPPKMNWRIHKAKWSDCDKCDLCETRNRVVLLRGQLPCDVMFIGEAPGTSEDSRGKPFIGPSGRFLESMIEEALKEVGIGTVRIAFTNLVACIPKEDGAKVHDPPEKAVKACAPRLLEIVKLAKPKGLVMVGKVAQKYAPKYLEYDPDYSADVIHPAAILQADVSQQSLAMQRTIVTLRDLFNQVKQCQPQSKSVPLKRKRQVQKSRPVKGSSN